MIKFFRKLRQSLLAKRKFKQYLKYAIGEIVLVVIGILIALQINTWNSNRINLNKTQKFLTSLQRDLSNDLNSIEGVILEQNIRYTSIDELISLSRDPEIESIISNDTVKLTRTGRNFTFFPVVGAYKAANNSGLLENLKDDSLKHDIYNLYEHLYPRLNYNGEINDSRYEMVDWESRNYIDYTQVELTFRREALLEENFINQLGYLNRFIKIYIGRSHQTKEAIQSVLNKIKDELEDNH